MLRGLMTRTNCSTSATSSNSRLMASTSKEPATRRLNVCQYEVLALSSAFTCTSSTSACRIVGCDSRCARWAMVEK